MNEAMGRESERGGTLMGGLIILLFFHKKMHLVSEWGEKVCERKNGLKGDE